MNTLKMKVLLFILNMHLWRSVGRAILIWILTGITGGLILTSITIWESPKWPNFLNAVCSAAGLGLFFSIPVILIAIPVLYFLPCFETTLNRIIFSVFSILITCSFLLVVLTNMFGFRYSEILEVTFPFILSAFGSYFFIMRKSITKPYPA